MSVTCKVISVSINQPIPASEFQIDFPKGTRITDLRNEQGRENAREKRRAEMAANVMAARRRNPPPAKACYDPFADAEADVEVALKAARETHKRVMLEFGANWCPGCRYLTVALKENPEVSADLKKSFVLVLVDTESETGKRIHEKYVPTRQRNSIPHLAVLEADGKVLKNDDTTKLGDDDFDPAKLQAFLAEWSPSK
jgi:thiol:disulfide interchange protein